MSDMPIDKKTFAASDTVFAVSEGGRTMTLHGDGTVAIRYASGKTERFFGRGKPAWREGDGGKCHNLGIFWYETESAAREVCGEIAAEFDDQDETWKTRLWKRMWSDLPDFIMSYDTKGEKK